MDYLVDGIILYVVMSLVIGHFFLHKALAYELKNGPRLRSAPALILYYLWAIVYWPKVLYKILKKEAW